MDQFIYRLTPVREDLLSAGPTAREAEIIGIHFDYLSNLKNQGVVKLAGRTTNTDATSFGVVIFEAADPAVAGEIMSRDPAVRENVLAARLFPFRIALMGNPAE